MKRELKSYLAGWLALYLAAVCLPFLSWRMLPVTVRHPGLWTEKPPVTLRMSVAGAVGTRTDGNGG